MFLNYWMSLSHVLTIAVLFDISVGYGWALKCEVTGGHTSSWISALYTELVCSFSLYTMQKINMELYWNLLIINFMQQYMYLVLKVEINKIVFFCCCCCFCFVAILRFSENIFLPLKNYISCVKCKQNICVEITTSMTGVQ